MNEPAAVTDHPAGSGAAAGAARRQQPRNWLALAVALSCWQAESASVLQPRGIVRAEAPSPVRRAAQRDFYLGAYNDVRWREAVRGMR